MEEKTQRQGGLDREVRVLPLRASRARSVRFPGGDGRRGQPDGDVASTDQSAIIGGPVLDVVLCLVRGMDSRLTYVECGMDPGKSRNIPDQVFDRRQAGRKVTARQSRASHLIPAMSRNIPDRNFDRGYRGPRGPRAEWCRWRLPRRLWRARHQPACAEHASVSRAVGAAVVTASGPWLGPCGASWDARSASCSAAFSPLIFLPCYPFHLTTRR